MRRETVLYCVCVCVLMTMFSNVAIHKIVTEPSYTPAYTHTNIHPTFTLIAPHARTHLHIHPYFLNHGTTHAHTDTQIHTHTHTHTHTQLTRHLKHAEPLGIEYEDFAVALHSPHYHTLSTRPCPFALHRRSEREIEKEKKRKKITGTNARTHTHTRTPPQAG